MQCYWPIAEPLVGDATVDTTKLSQWQRLSWRNVRSNWNDNYTAQFRFDFEGMASNTIAYIDDVMLIDLTAAFGAGNEPTQEWCDANIEYFAGNKTIQYEAPNKYDLTVTTPTKIQTGDILNCPYSGSMKSIILPKGQYQLECWGAQGGNGTNNTSQPGGKGGYSKGIITLNKKTNLYLYAGGQGLNGTTYNQNGATTAGGFNGGGSATSANSRGSGGGGTDIRIAVDSLYARVLVAGGGSGSSGYTSLAGFAGGGISGKTYNNQDSSNSGDWYGGGGSQTQEGAAGTSYSNYTTAGNFGQGGNYNGDSNSWYGSGGGGGWYGGGGAIGVGGGGSGYMYTSSSASYYPSGCLLDSSHYLTNATTLAGNTAFTSPTGTSETGHAGNGYIRITVIEASSGNTLVKTTSNDWKEPVQMFVNTGINTAIPSGLLGLEYIESTGTQYIDTGIKASKNLKVEADIDVSPASGWVMILGDYTNGSYFSWWRQNTTMYAYYGSNNKTLAELTGKRKYIANDTNNIWSIDTSKITVTPNSSDFSKNGNNLYLFSVNNGGNYNKASMKLYSCKIYDNNTLVRDFIPAKRISDNKCGLWDKVNLKFYTDENGGNFMAGTINSIIPEIGTPIEYIQSSGTQYINSNFIPKATTRTIMKAEPMAWSAWSAFFGTRNTTAPTAPQAYIAAIPAATLYRSDYFGSSLTAETPTVMQITNIDKNKNICSFNNIMITNTSSTTNATTNMFLLALNDVGTAKYFLSAKLYSCQIYDGNTLVRDFIPVKTTTKIYGLWDNVNKVFYKNAGTGAFTGGSPITLTGWHKIKGVWAKTAADTWSQTL